MHVLAGDVLSAPPHGHNSRKVRVTTVASFITEIVVLLLQYYFEYSPVIGIYIVYCIRA